MISSRTSRVFLGAVLCVALTLAAACGGDNGTGPTHPVQPPPDTTSNPDSTTPADTGSASDTATVSATTVNNVAAELYATLATAQDPSEEITGILQSFMPVLGAADSTALDSFIATGVPVATDFQVSLVAQAYRDGDMVSLDNFIAAAAAAGATAEDPAGPLTRDYLTAKLAPLVNQTTFTAADVVPAFVLALGRVRAQASDAGITDPVWGDDQLGPLQTMLLLYAINYSGDASASADVRAASVAPFAASFTTGRLSTSRDRALAEVSLTEPGKLGKFAIKSIITSKIGQLIKFPLGYLDSIKASICASTLLYSYKFQASQSENDLWHQDPSHPDHPYQSQLNATLIFDFVPNANGKRVLAAINCPVPPPGPVAGKTVQWTIGDTLKMHGSLQHDEATTDASGQASTTYQTIPEIVPAALQDLAPLDAIGVWQVRATGLIPKWATLERVLDVVALPTDTVIAAIGIHYHKLPTAFDVTVHDSISSRETADEGGTNFDVAVHGTGHLVLTDSTHVAYQGQVAIDYDSFDISVVDDQGCQGLSPAGTTPGHMVGLISTAAAGTDAPSGLLGLQIALLPEAGGPVEHVNIECAGEVQTEYFAGAWSGLRTTPPPPASLDTLLKVGPTTLRRVIARSGPISGMGTVTENATIDLKAILP